MKKTEEDYIATVGDLINHLQTHFKPTDKLCFGYEGGAYVNYENVLKDMLGDNMFLYVKDEKKRRIEKFKITQEEVDEDFQFVKDDDVLTF